MRKNLTVSICFVFVISFFINVSFTHGQVSFADNSPSINKQNLPVPRFEDADCAVQLSKSDNARCGYLIVPESRKIKNDKTLRLPIIILKSDNPNPQPDPILRTFGGPGSSSMNLVRSRPASP